MKKISILKEENSYTKIIGVGILALAMVSATLIIGMMFTTPIEANSGDCELCEFDFGDAPDPTYPTLLASKGARHVNGTGYYLGASIDNESNGQPSADALGDDSAGIDDEDGVAWTLLKQGYMTKVTVTTNIPVGAGNGNLSAWIDFNKDGDWNDTGEQIIADVSLGTGVSEHWFKVPCSAVEGYTYMRFRFSTHSELPSYGPADNGEVEDYRVYIWPDNEYPSQSVEFGAPHIIRNWEGQNYYVIGPKTPVWINSSDGCPGTEKIEYSIWVAEDLEDPIVWTFLWNLTVYDNDENDLDKTDGSIVTKFTNDETCFHELRYQCWDYDGVTEGLFSEDYFVDKCGPITTKTVGCPKYSYGWPYPPWISGVTPITFSSVDNCCLPNGTNVDKITIKVWWKKNTCNSSDAYILIDTIVVKDGDPNDLNPAYGRIGYEFHFTKSGYYELEYWGVDMMGNVESHHKQQHRVDVDYPHLWKTYPEGGFHEIVPHEGFLESCKPINLTAQEKPSDTCNAGLYGIFWRYKWNDTLYPAAGEIGAVNGEDIVDDLCIVASEISDYWWYLYDEEIHFCEECRHDMYKFAIDNVGNYDKVHHQIYYIDKTPPKVTKEIGEPKCQNDLPEGDYCITSETPIWINVTDNGTEPCIVGSVHLYYRIWYEGEWKEYHSYVPEGTLIEEIYLKSECIHHLEFYVEDNVGNRWPEKGYHNETFYVDNTPPIIKKEVGKPNCPVPDTKDDYCVNLSTLITLSAEEVGCCQNETFTLEYRIWYMDGWTDWMAYDGPFNFTEECMHILEVRAYDCLGNGKSEKYWHSETFYVDETPPKISKKVGEPNCPVPGTDDYCVNLSTEITLDATNGGCCPNEDNTLKYRIWSEKEGWTGWMPYEGPFTFEEECKHYLEVVAADCIGNEAFDNETFYVDETPPKISKKVGLPNCPVPGTDDYCVNLSTLITLDAEEQGCCKNGTVTLEYRIWFDGVWSKWTSYVDPFSFDKECMHYLEVRAIDCLGNEELDNETFYVDETPPKIFKDVGKPNCPIPDTPDYCVNLSTLITLSAEEKGCCKNGTVTIMYRIWVEDKGWTGWKYYKEPFSFDEECKHYLEVLAFDCLGNEELDNETFYVDETPPEITKKVGEPNCPIPGTDDYCVNLSTLITLSAEEKGCCKKGVEVLKYRIWSEKEGWSDWIPYRSPFTFKEECKHYLEVVAIDCLGNEAFDNETFYVDDTPPEIFKDVCLPNCPIPDSDDYCVNLSTLITLDTFEKGCCQNGTVTLEYRIWIKEKGWSSWKEYERPFSFTEECMHYLEVRATDCLGNKALDNETFYVDETPPKISKEVGVPNCPVPGTDDYCVNLSTLIYLDAKEEGCCKNGTVTLEYRIWFDGVWSKWTSYVEPFSFEEECMHYLEVRAIDCLGNEAFDNETFYVDETPPKIIKDVGIPNCPVPGTDDYCVNLSTLITLSAEEKGCCKNGTITLEYRIWSEKEGWSDWIPYRSPFSFEEECMHYLEVRATDCLGNKALDNETFYVDETDPVIEKTVGIPNCEIIKGSEYCVTTETNITINAYDKGCCDDLTVKYRINGEAWVDITDKLPYNLSFEEECNHTLEIWAYDCIGNEDYDTELFHVDDTYPKIVKKVGDPNCVIEEGFKYCVNLSTIITIDAYDDGCCDDFTVKYKTNKDELWIDITDKLPYDLSFKEECMHELWIKAYDCLGHETTDYEIFYVDETPPKLEKTVGDPHFFLGNDSYGHHVWLIYPETDICFEAIDQGCCEGGGTFIYYRYWYYGTWTDWMKYEGCINLEEGCVHYLEAYATDCLGNAGEIDNETFWVCGPGGGDGDPNIEIIFPEHGSTQKTDYLEVILHAYDDKTAWEDLGVYLWIPGGRRDAPYLYFDVYPLDEENETYIAYVPIYWYQDGAQVTLNAMAFDEDGNTGYALPVTFKVDTTIVWDQWMQYGWNPLPLSGGMPPDFGCNESIESVMYSVNGSYDWIFHYDLDEGWTSYYTEREINELTTIEGGKGYWVHIFNENGLRYYIGVGEIEILSPEDEAILCDLEEIYGTTWNSETGMEEVHIQIYYKDESDVKHYWNGSDWVLSAVYLPCDLGAGYIQDWSFDSSGVSWIPGETFYAKARGMDKFGCYAFDMVSFIIIPCEVCPVGSGATVIPDYFEATMIPGESVWDNKTIITDEIPIGKLDVLFLFDLTGSMSGQLSTAKSSSIDIMNDIRALIDDSAFGVGSFMDYPDFDSEGYCEYDRLYGSSSSGDYAWSLDQDITTSTASVSSAINSLVLGYGSDSPEAYARALYESQFVGWRTGARKIVIIFEDADPHDCDWTTFGCDSYSTGVDPGRDATAGTSDDLPWVDVIDDLKNADISVVSVASYSITCPWEYATDETGGIASILGDVSTLPEKIVALVENVTAKISKLTLEPSEGYEDWFDWDPLAYYDVGGNETVHFNVSITVPEETPSGSYNICLKVIGDGSILAVQEIEITVESGVWV